MPDTPRSPRWLIRAQAERFQAAGVPDPLWDAAALLAKVTGRQALSLRMDGDTALPSAEAAAYLALCERRAAREPLQYLLGSQPFCGRDFQVTPDVLIPRPETELLAAEALARLRDIPQPAVLDLCCGSGCLGITLALDCPAARVHASDLSAAALAVAAENARRLGAEVVFHQGDLMDWAEDERFHLVVSNPPYIPTAVCETLQAEVRREPGMALDGGTDGLHFYRRIAAELPRHLHPGGWLLVEIGSDQGETVPALLQAAGWGDLQLKLDEAGLPRVVIARWRTHVGTV